MQTETGHLTYQFLKEITDNFSKDRQLGAGASGKVFRGASKYGGKVAVKLLYERPGLDDHLFENEFNNLMILKHPNIVSLLGHCNETQKVPVEFNGRVVLAERTHRALCFEYLGNGNLKGHLYDESSGPDWNTRYKIIKGICEGLKYLHKGQRHPIYHLDLKPENILLDNNMVPKLADFGLSKILAADKTRSTANSYGTHGYIPPEFIDRKIISSKFDIFSLGVVIIKIVAGPTGYTESADMSDQKFIDRTQRKWRNRLQAQRNGSLLDGYCQQVKMCIELALNCVEKDRNKRPDIVTIIQKLRQTENLIDELIDLQDTEEGTVLGLIGRFGMRSILCWLRYLTKPNHSSIALSAISTKVTREDNVYKTDATVTSEEVEAIGLGPSKQHGVPSRMMGNWILRSRHGRHAWATSTSPVYSTPRNQPWSRRYAPSMCSMPTTTGSLTRWNFRLCWPEKLGIPEDAAVCRDMIVAAGGNSDGSSPVRAAPRARPGP